MAGKGQLLWLEKDNAMAVNGDWQLPTGNVQNRGVRSLLTSNSAYLNPYQGVCLSIV